MKSLTDTACFIPPFLDKRTNHFAKLNALLIKFFKDILFTVANFKC